QQLFHLLRPQVHAADLEHRIHAPQRPREEAAVRTAATACPGGYQLDLVPHCEPDNRARLAVAGREDDFGLAFVDQFAARGMTGLDEQVFAVEMVAAL